MPKSLNRILEVSKPKEEPAEGMVSGSGESWRTLKQLLDRGNLRK
jgi:hypothetical protein